MTNARASNGNAIRFRVIFELGRYGNQRVNMLGNLVSAVGQQFIDAKYFGLHCLLRHVALPDREGAIKVNTRFGQFFVRKKNSDFRVLRQIFAKSEYDIESHLPGKSLRDTYVDALRRGRQAVIIDCGANAGYSSIFFARSFPQARVIAIEPDYDNYQLLLRNTNTIANIVAIHAAVGCEEGNVVLNKTAGHSWGTTTTRTHSDGVKVCTINALVKEFGSELLLVKIDIEGFEYDLFSQNIEWIEFAKAIIVEPHDWIYPGTSHTMQRALMNSNMELLVIGENLAWVRS